MDSELTFGEYVRRLRRQKGWGLEELAAATGLSVSHLSRFENDKALPNTESVVKLANALDGELERMLQLADCLPGEILDRLIRRADGDARVLKRSTGRASVDRRFQQALVDDIDPTIRRALAQAFDLSDRDVEGLFSVLRRMKRMKRSEREAVIRFFADGAGAAEE